MQRIVLSNCSRFPDGIAEDGLLRAALERRGFVVESVVWGEPIPEHALVVLRGVWDYVDRPDEFLDWVRSLGPRVWNPAPLVEWNHHKSYLKDLARRGCRVVPTGFLPKGEIAEVTGVVKPAIGSGARGARRVEKEEVVAHEDLIVQPFLAAIGVQGELSLVYFAGEFSHAVRKLPAAGDWRVQVEHGGSVDAHEPSAEELAVAFFALSGVDHLYARVDLVRDLHGRPAVMELELIEPELFLREDAGAADRFAAAIEGRARCEE